MNHAVEDLILFAIENPLIDISKEFDNDEILTKYELQHGQACLASDKQMPLYEELWKMEGVEIIPGGSAQNTLRAANFMLKEKHPNKCAFVGSIGKDEKGEALERVLDKEGVISSFNKDETAPTGSCAVLVVN